MSRENFTQENVNRIVNGLVAYDPAIVIAALDELRTLRDTTPEGNKDAMRDFFKAIDAACAIDPRARPLTFGSAGYSGFRERFKDILNGAREEKKGVSEEKKSDKSDVAGLTRATGGSGTFRSAPASESRPESAPGHQV